MTTRAPPLSPLKPSLLHTCSGDLTLLPSKRNAPSVATLQRDLQNEKDKTQRLGESVEQLRLELQMMGRLLASTREQLISCGGMTMPSNVGVRVPPPPVVGVRPGARSKSDAKMVQRLQDELSEGRGQNRRLGETVDTLQQKLLLVAASKKEMVGALTEMQEYLNSHR